jgi:hypothetical protein
MPNQKRENSNQSHCKVQQNLMKPWQKSIKLTFTLVIMIFDENGYNSVSVSTYSQKRMPTQIQALQTTRGVGAGGGGGDCHRKWGGGGRGSQVLILSRPYLTIPYTS